MNPVWMPPANDTIKINVHGTVPVLQLDNSNTNAVGILARNSGCEYVHGIMGPLRGANEFQAQLWAIHIAMKWAFDKKLPKVIIETDNIAAFQIYRHQNDEEVVIEEEDLSEVLHQLSMLKYQYNRPRGKGKQGWSCEVRSVMNTRNEAAFLMARYAIANCGALVEAPSPIAAIREQLDIDAGFGPHREMLAIQPNHGMGEVFYPERIPACEVQREVFVIEDEPVPQKVSKQRGGIVIKETHVAGIGKNLPPVVGKGKAKMYAGESSKF